MPTKRQVKRFTKKELRDICSKNNLQYEKKAKKNDLFNTLWNNRAVCSKLQVKQPRKLSEKQKETLQKNRKPFQKKIA